MLFLLALADKYSTISGNFFKCLNSLNFIQTIFTVFRQLSSFNLLLSENREISLEGLKAIIYFNFAPFVIAGVRYINFDSMPVNFNFLLLKFLSKCKYIEFFFKIICYLSILSGFDKGIHLRTKNLD